jgi:hypothetical protein
MAASLPLHKGSPSQTSFAAYVASTAVSPKPHKGGGKISFEANNGGDNSPNRNKINSDLGAILTKPPSGNSPPRADPARQTKIVLTTMPAPPNDKHMKVLSIAKVQEDQREMQQNTAKHGQMDKQILSQLLKKNKMKIKED